MERQQNRVRPYHAVLTPTSADHVADLVIYRHGATFTKKAGPNFSLETWADLAIIQQLAQLKPSWTVQQIADWLIDPLPTCGDQPPFLFLYENKREALQHLHQLLD